MTWRSCVSAHLLRCCVRARTKTEWERGGVGGCGRGWGGGWMAGRGGFYGTRVTMRENVKEKGREVKRSTLIASRRTALVCIENSNGRLIRWINAAAAHKNAAIVNYQCGLNCCVQSGWERDLLFRRSCRDNTCEIYTQESLHYNRHSNKQNVDDAHNKCSI